MEKQQIIIW